MRDDVVAIWRRALSVLLAAVLALGTLPSQALAGMAEEAMGEEPVATAQVPGRDEGRGEAVAGVGAGLAPEAEEVAPTETTPVGEPPVEGVAPQAEPGVGVQATQPTPLAGQLRNPRVVTKSGMSSGQVVTWDCVWLGSYPQTEAPETDALMNASWTDGDATVDGVRYRRIAKSDATNSKDWPNSAVEYRYFRYEPIKWRILKVNGGTALAVADVALDCRPYHTSQSSVTWETSAIRSWLNGTGTVPYYSSGAQSGHTARAFAEVAFTEDQLGAVLQSEIANAENTEFGTPGGNATTDRIFLLSEAEVHGDSATAHGFVSGPGTSDEARRCKPSEYARAMGAWVEASDSYAGNCWWWLRSPGRYAYDAAGVDLDGSVYRYGYNVGYDDGYYAVRPALNLNLSSTHLTRAGTVSSDGAVAESRPITSVEVTGDVTAYDGAGKTPAVTVRSNGLVVPEAGYDLSYASNTAAGTATVKAVGRDGYEGEATATFQIAPRPVTVTADDKTKAYGEPDPELTVTVGGLLDGDTVSYTFSRESGEGLGEHAITPSGDAVQGNYVVTYVPGKLTVIPADVTAADVDPIAPRSYTGSPIAPRPVVRMGEATLAEGTDYDLSYASNVGPGTATVTIAGRGNYKGTKTTEFSIGEPTKSSSASNPRVEPKSGMESGQVVTWDCVWLGSYPQTEVAETDALKNADWTDGDATVGGVRYRRIARSDATYSSRWSDDGYGSAAYRYFRYEPIKWRVLKADGGTALAVADVALDCRKYYEGNASVTWEASSVRSWLNGTDDAPYYTSGAQSGRTAQAFAGVAFTAEQLGAVRESTIANAANTQFGTSGGNATTDRVFLLSEAEVHGDSATEHGFVSGPGTSDEARRCRPSEYARAMGAGVSTSGSYAGNCWWWLRSPGYYAQYAAYVNDDGNVTRYGSHVDRDDNAVRPALNLDLSSPHLAWAGTVSSDGTAAESRPITSVEVTETGLTYDDTEKTPAVTVWSNGVPVPDTGYDLSYEGNTAAGTATVKAAGRDGYEGEATATFQIARRPVTVSGVQATKTYGSPDPALATVEGLVGDDTVSYDVSRGQGEAPGEYAITPTGATEQGNYAVTYVPGKLTIAKADVSAAEVAPIAPHTYTGRAVTPEPSVALGGRTLAKDADYTLSYANNVNAGTATVTVTGKGNFSGTKGATFRIDPASVSAVTVSPASFTYDGEAKTPGVTVRAGSLAVPASGYTVKYANNVNAGTATVTVTGKGNFSGTKSATFKITAAPVPAPAKTFPDVPAGAWYAGVVSRAAGLGLINGYKDGRFGPADNVTRGQVAVILWNMAGKPSTKGTPKSFPDVKAGKYYCDAVRWASSVGVVSGYKTGKFGPDDLVTREQLAVMLANYAGKVAGRDTSGSAADYKSMKDAGEVSSWAAKSVGWCFRNKIISGTKDGRVNPQGNVTRAETAKMVVFLHDLLQQ